MLVVEDRRVKALLDKVIDEHPRTTVILRPRCRGNAKRSAHREYIVALPCRSRARSLRWSSRRRRQNGNSASSATTSTARPSRSINPSSRNPLAANRQRRRLSRRQRLAGR